MQNPSPFLLLERDYFTHLFELVDTKKDGNAPANAVSELFTKSTLPRNTLAEV
jgi:hypothetical protein